MADWRKYRISVESMFKELKAFTDGKTVEGMEAYKAEILLMIVEAETFIEAQRDLQEMEGAYARSLADQDWRINRAKEISDAKLTLTNNARSFKTFQTKLAEDIVAFKRDIFVDFHECVLAFMYYNVAEEYPPSLNISAKLGPNDFDLALIEFGNLRNGSDTTWGTIGPQQLHYSTSTHCAGTAEGLDVVFQDDWKD